MVDDEGVERGGAACWPSSELHWLPSSTDKGEFGNKVKAVCAVPRDSQSPRGWLHGLMGGGGH